MGSGHPLGGARTSRPRGSYTWPATPGGRRSGVEGDKGGQGRSRDPTAAGQGRTAALPHPRSPSPPGARQPLEHGASARAHAQQRVPPRLTIRQRVPPPPARTRALAASGRPLNGSLFRSRQPGPQGCRGAAGGARRGERCGGHRGGRAGAKRSFTCGILDVSEGDRPPRSGERALSDCGHLTRIPGRASRANRNALKGRCDQWAGARRAAAQ